MKRKTLWTKEIQMEKNRIQCNSHRVDELRNNHDWHGFKLQVIWEIHIQHCIVSPV